MDRMNNIRLIVGLGNPGREYEATRHNVGFWWLDEIAASQNCSFKQENAFQGMLAKCKIQHQEVYLLKPQTFMNLSGRSVAALARFYKIEMNQMLVVHDELDLAPGIARLKTGGGHGGHNGLKDIIAQLGGRDFWRLRLGIGHPGDKAAVAGFVLNKPSADDRDAIDRAMTNAHHVLDLIVDGKMDAAMLKLHSHK